MKIIECIKEFPLLIKRMEANSAKIQQYASTTTLQDDLPFGTIEAQTREVASLVKANEDLFERYMHLARSLMLTNATTIVVIGDQARSITEWLHIRGAGKLSAIAMDKLVQTYQSLNTNTAQAQLRANNGKVDLTEKALQAIRCYDQKKVDEKASAFLELRGMIDAKLEIVNATTELVETK